MKLIITGSLDFTDDTYLRHTIKKICSEYDLLEIVCGTENRGINWVAKSLAVELGIPIKEFAVDENRYGRRAGFVRNELMIAYGTALLVIWDGKSPGTKHMINTALKQGLSACIHNITPITGNADGALPL